MSAKANERGDDAGNSGLIHAQIVENARIAPSCILGNFVAIIACGEMLFAHGLLTHRMMAMALSAVAMIVFWRVQTARKIIKSGDDHGDAIRLRTRIVAIATALGTVWAAIVWFMMSSGNRDVQFVGGIVGAGMLCAGTLAFRTVREAALSYVTICAIGCGAGLVAIGGMVSVVGLVFAFCYLVILYSNIKATADRFNNAWWRERHLAEAADTVQLLLNDMTEQGTEMLIELNSSGRLENPCAKITDLVECSAEDLAAVQFSSLFLNASDRIAFSRKLDEGQIIRQQIIKIGKEASPKWISLSVRPKSDRSGYRGVVSDVTAQRIAEQNVSYLAHFDALTRLPNRILFNQHVESSLLRYGGRIAILYLDLDNFKLINDTLGHPIGDRVLTEVGRRIEMAIGQYDVACRFGGDEFVILVSGTRVEKVDRLASRILRELSAKFAVDDIDIDLACSIGIAVGPEDGGTADCLIRRADIALYAAKSRGRSQAIRFDVAMDEATQVRRNIETDLRNAIGNGEMQLHYQPMVAADSNAVCGFEALIRWNHPNRGVIMPNSFIPIAEETGLIVPLGEWVLRQSLKDAAGWPDDVSISINLSPVQLRSSSLLGTLVQALASSGVAPHRVCIEITESVLLDENTSNLELLHKIRSLGVRISLDDFGTGFSSLNYLRTFPFDKIKIDRCFVSEIEESADCQAIVRSVISLATSLGIIAVAEGVERPSQADLLRREGCAELQGYLYSQARPQFELGRFFGGIAEVPQVA